MSSAASSGVIAFASSDRTMINSFDGIADAIVTCGGRKCGGSQAVDRRTALNRFSRDQRLQEGADTSARRIAVAAFLERPRASGDADDDISRGCRSFFSDEEMQLACVRRAQTGEQPLSRHGVLSEFDVAIEVKAERARHAPVPSP